MTFKEIIRITLNLTILYLIGGILLASVYAKTSPVIFKKNEQEKKEALQKMMPDADLIEKIGDWHPYEKHAEYFVAKKSGEKIGHVVQTFGKGYSSYINILFSVDADLKVKKMKVLHHAETPGLGDEIEAAYFEKQFEDKDIEHLTVVKIEKPGYILAITGATISTRAVSEDGIRNGLKFLMSALKGEVKHE